MKTLIDYKPGEIEDVILVVDDRHVSLSSLGCLPLGGAEQCWLRIVPHAESLNETEMNAHLMNLMQCVRKIKTGRKKIRFALNYSGADVQLSPGFLAALGAASCRIEMAVVPIVARQQLAERKQLYKDTMRPFA